ncbi:MAG: undecaprenyldiphospho-muramoylpentapeptide beta-N-acetylglucosaminyltransferase [Candidatus Cloacimonetes bacterium]|nr:undecaprenyldiphospho-muramoylpentapeptide beta-N-acetylglucosaminyltransferase [Candidatus Cloacimonadota bacterium]MCK9177864.1 undecaprenyldiphospho-muramoylpentapeptide beta-N-acetylglucosaminyltransferase [Candidatus Cloacimonadota bacterium]MDD3103221.1 undecaprenyldiphospho-muramoylpentapeptide beta-N-acetylglucosaminyltransferase [Candidatus Cloacimonadota bacterium]MDD3533489.1 undecaprenyldiphospho-muramoylpentapeptide beta-N-acetylglucosaminyltransferase [Candidatus Cloacimonadota 
MRFAFGAGGTGGHIIPALALADELTLQGHECIFIGNRNSMEERLAREHKYTFLTIRVQKLYRKISLSNLLFPYYLASSIQESRRHLSSNQIDGVITTGGFVAGPVAIAAISLKIPCFLHESNSYPGLTTRYLAKYLSRLYISFEDTRKYLKKGNFRNFGIPILKHTDDLAFDLTEIGFDKGKKSLLITGGSQGSLAINNVVASVITVLLEDDWQVMWQTGRTTYASFYTQHKDREGLYIFDFHPRLAAMMRISDLAITRAGAMTIAELEDARLPAIMIPLPSAADNHQHYNALAQKHKGVAELLPQSELGAQTLLTLIKNLKLENMKEKLDTLPENTAVTDIVQNILNFYKEI